MTYSHAWFLMMVVFTLRSVLVRRAYLTCNLTTCRLAFSRTLPPPRDWLLRCNHVVRVVLQHVITSTRASLSTRQIIERLRRANRSVLPPQRQLVHELEIAQAQIKPSLHKRPHRQRTTGKSMCPCCVRARLRRPLTKLSSASVMRRGSRWRC